MSGDLKTCPRRVRMVQIVHVGGFRYGVTPTNRPWIASAAKGVGSMKGAPCSGHVSCHWILFHLLLCNWHGSLERSWTLVFSVIMAEVNEVCETTELWNIMTTFFTLYSIYSNYCHCRWYIMHKDAIFYYLSMSHFFLYSKTICRI